jgi:hypothetical protein
MRLDTCDRVYYVLYVVHERLYYVPYVVRERVYYVLYGVPRYVPTKGCWPELVEPGFLAYVEHWRVY